MFQPKLLFLGRNNMIHHLCAPAGESGAVECVYIPEQVFPKMALPNTLLKKKPIQITLVARASARFIRRLIRVLVIFIIFNCRCCGDI